MRLSPSYVPKNKKLGTNKDVYVPKNAISGTLIEFLSNI